MSKKKRFGAAKELLVRLREFAAEKRESSRKQSKIDSYFSRSGVANNS